MIRPIEIPIMAKTDVSELMLDIPTKLQTAVVEGMTENSRNNPMYGLLFIKGTKGKIVAEGKGLTTAEELRNFTSIFKVKATNCYPNMGDVGDDFFLYTIHNEYLMINTMQYVKHYWEFL